MGGGASEWHSFQSMCGRTRSVHRSNAWAHTWRAPTVRPIKAKYLKIVTIRPLNTDPTPCQADNHLTNALRSTHKVEIGRHTPPTPPVRQHSKVKQMSMLPVEP